MKEKRWQDWANGALGLWMFLSPWILGFDSLMSNAARSAWVLGFAIVVFASLAVYMPKAWEEALNVILGLLLLTSPWSVGYVDTGGATPNGVIVGALVTALAVWAMVKDSAVQRWWHEHHPVH
jgi:hypothetical protein